MNRAGLSDSDQLAFAVRQRRALLTHNIRDYALLDREYRTKGQSHYRDSCLRSSGVPRAACLRTLRCLGRKTEADIRNEVVWLQDFK